MSETGNSRKLRYSMQREKILEYIHHSKDHPTAEMIYQDLKGEISNISLGTVYRNLKLLEETNKIRRITTLQNAERYEINCEDDHAHFVCQICGQVFNLPPIDPVAARTVCNVTDEMEIKWMTVTFGGICKECMAN